MDIFENDSTRPEKPKDVDEAIPKKEFEKLYCRYVTTRNLMFYFVGITVGIIISAYLRGD